jgi:hypothetical protein
MTQITTATTAATTSTTTRRFSSEDRDETSAIIGNLSCQRLMRHTYPASATINQWQRNVLVGQLCEQPLERVSASAGRNGTAMVTSADVHGRRMTICPACGYPSTGLCAACSQISPAGHADLTTNTVTVSDFNPAA